MRLVRATFEDMEELCDSLRSWDAELYPISSLRSEKSAGTLVQAGAEDCQYMFAGFDGGLRMFGSPPSGLVTFNLMEPTQRRYWWRGHDLDSAMVWVFPVGGELRSVSAPGFRVHTLSVTEDRVESVAETCGIDLPPPSKRPEVFPAPEDVLQHVRALLNAMRDGTSPLPFRAVGDILRLLVPLWLKPSVWNDRGRPSMRARDLAIRKSLELMEVCDLSELTLEDLLEEFRVSERTLQYAFRERFGISPAAFIKSRRLVEVRAALRRAEPGQDTVGDIAANLGFWHLSQFATDYRKAFGERPSDTLQSFQGI